MSLATFCQNMSRQHFPSASATSTPTTDVEAREREALCILLTALSVVAFILAISLVSYILYFLFSNLLSDCDLRRPRQTCFCSSRSCQQPFRQNTITLEISNHVVDHPPSYHQVESPPPSYETVIDVQMPPQQPKQTQ